MQIAPINLGNYLRVDKTQQASGTRAISNDDLLARGVPMFTTEQADGYMAYAKEQMDAAFAQNHIANNPPVTLSVDRMGKIVVGDHPQKADIQKLFQGNEELERTVQQSMVIKSQQVDLQRAVMANSAYSSMYDSMGESAANAMLARFTSMASPSMQASYSSSGFSATFDGLSSDDYLAKFVSQLGIDRYLSYDIAA